MFWFFIRRSKTADLVWNLVYIILEFFKQQKQTKTKENEKNQKNEEKPKKMLIEY